MRKFPRARKSKFEVSSFDNAKALLEALGYRVSVMYEKYRTTYDWGGCEVTLDEMPYGDFAEIEGPWCRHHPQGGQHPGTGLGGPFQRKLPDALQPPVPGAVWQPKT